VKIEARKIITFLKKIKMKDSEEITQCLLDFTDSGLKVNATSPAKFCMVEGFMDKAVFDSYDAIGKIGLNDFPKFITILDRFGKMVEFSLEGNLLMVKEKKKSVDIPLVDEKYFEEGKKPELKDFVDTVPIAADTLNGIFKDAEMSNDSTITIETQQGEAIFTNTGRYKFKTVIEDSSIQGGAKSTFGRPIISALRELKEKLVLSVGANYPMQVEEKCDDSEIKIIVAPRVEEK